MKKCASCTKDLPEAALHCVFCGAKQPPAPAVQPGLAKTAFGYSANDLIDPAKPAAPLPSLPPWQPPRGAPGSQPPAYAQTTLAQSNNYPAPSGPGYGGMQANPANAATMIANSAPAPMLPAPYQASGGMGVQSARQITPPVPLPIVSNDPPPYLSSASAASAGRPIEPWRDSLRIVMFVWGAVLLAAFATPLSTDPMAFQWDAILHGEGLQKLQPLLLGAVGLLSVVLAGIPMPALARGLLAAVLGLAALFVPVFSLGMPPWQALVPIAGMVLLLPGLFARNEYVDALVPRILVTIGAICMLVPMLIPDDQGIPLVNMIKTVLEMPTSVKVLTLIGLMTIVFVVLSLLAWLPGPSTAGAKIFAWLIILWPTLVVQLAGLAIEGHIGDAIKKSPSGALMEWAPIAAYSFLYGYGLATVVGKRLE